MGKKAWAFDALTKALRKSPNNDKKWKAVDEAQVAYDAVVCEYALTRLDEEYTAIRAAVMDMGGENSAAYAILRWCEDVNARVLGGE